MLTSYLILAQTPLDALNENRSKAAAERRREDRANFHRTNIGGASPDENDNIPRSSIYSKRHYGRDNEKTEYRSSSTRYGRITPSRKLIKKYDELARKRSAEGKEARNKQRKVFINPDLKPDDYSAAKAEADKATDRENTAGQMAYDVGAAHVLNHDYRRDAIARGKALSRRDRKIARREKVKIPRAERKRRQFQKAEMIRQEEENRRKEQQERKEAARNALLTYERNAQETAHDDNDVRGGTFHKGTILSKKEKFDKKWKAPGGKYKLSSPQDNTMLQLAQMSSAARRANEKKKAALASSKSEQPAQAPQPTRSEPPKPQQSAQTPPKTAPQSAPTAPQPQPSSRPTPTQTPPQPQPAPNAAKPKFHITGKHVAGAGLAAVGVTGAALAARHIYKKRKARKEAAAKKLKKRKVGGFR